MNTSNYCETCETEIIKKTAKEMLQKINAHIEEQKKLYNGYSENGNIYEAGFNSAVVNGLILASEILIDLQQEYGVEIEK